MKITFLVTGKTKKGFVSDGTKIYAERIKHYIPFSIIELPDIKLSFKSGEAVIKDKEGELIIKALSATDTVILLDEKGKMISSIEMAEFIRERSLGSVRNLVFVAGGAYGFSKRIYERANGIISLSKMTFSHQIVRIIFLEQLYRAFTIIRNEPYHHG